MHSPASPPLIPHLPCLCQIKPKGLYYEWNPSPRVVTRNDHGLWAFCTLYLYFTHLTSFILHSPLFTHRVSNDIWSLNFHFFRCLSCFDTSQIKPLSAAQLHHLCPASVGVSVCLPMELQEGMHIWPWQPPWPVWIAVTVTPKECLLTLRIEKPADLWLITQSGLGLYQVTPALMEKIANLNSLWLECLVFHQHIRGD